MVATGMAAPLLVVGTLAAAMSPHESSVQPTLQPTTFVIAPSEINATRGMVHSVQAEAPLMPSKMMSSPFIL